MQNMSDRIRKGALGTAALLTRQLCLIGVRFYSLKKGEEKHFREEIWIADYPSNWASRKARAKSDKATHPRNTPVRMAYAAELVDERRFSDAERELWLASVDTKAVAAVLPGESKAQLFVEWAKVLLLENKAKEARSVLFKVCGRDIDIARLDLRRPPRVKNEIISVFGVFIAITDLATNHHSMAVRILLWRAIA